MNASAPSADGSGRRHEVAVYRDVRIPTSGPGVTLSGDLFLPEGAGPAPLLLTLLPYRRDVTALSGSAAFRWFASRGYPSLLVDLLGLGSSDGVRRPPFHPDEADDALAAIDWALRQPWCDGTVGMWGGSYGGMTTMRAAARRPSALRAIVMLESTADPGRDFVHPGGARGALGPLGLWSMTMLLGQLLPPLDDYADLTEQSRWRSRMRSEPHLLDLFRPGPDDPVWLEGRIDASAIEVPALCFAGWRDLFCEGTLRAYEEMSGPKRLIAGPWLHTMPNESPHVAVDFLELALAWWDRWLRDEPNGVDKAPRVSVHVQGGRPRWLGLQEWPADAASRPASLADWERTEPHAPDAEPNTPDPATGVLSGLWAVPSGPFGLPLDQHDDDTRSLCLTSLPLAEPLLLCGRPRVTVARAWSRMSVKLTDVDPHGRSTLICAGLEARVQQDGTIEITLNPTAYELPAGHRLRIAVAPGDFPRVWPEHPGGDGLPEVTGLVLPVLPDDANPEEGLDYPAPDPNSLPAVRSEPPAATSATPTPPVWEIANDLLGNTVSVRIALSDDGAAVRHSHGRGHRIRGRQEVTATAHRAQPEAATVTVSAAGDVRTETGQHVAVEAEITAAATGVRATGRITLDGSLLLDQQWRAELPLTEASSRQD
ncbi:CocE/NonD family hydrolase [Streptomyces sp. NPDC059862]|uniref:CocE/NonD family hydrolase n=1 Tax=Streptomyces sp. NPDC059862 TaxID=3346975 RepID=UPI0036514BE8